MTFHILGIIIPTDEVIFFRGVAQPPTSCINGPCATAMLNYQRVHVLFGYGSKIGMIKLSHLKKWS